MGNLMIGNTYPSSIIRGQTNVSKVMCGSEQVWPRKSEWEYTVDIHFFRYTGVEEVVTLYYNYSDHTMDLSTWIGYSIAQDPSARGVYVQKDGIKKSKESIKETSSSSGLPVNAHIYEFEAGMEVGFDRTYWNALSAMGLDYDSIYITL